jgi:hypothetical protein
MITLRPGPAPTRSPRKGVTSSLWWPRTGIDRITAPADIPPLRDQRRQMSGRRAVAWSGTCIRTSTPFGSKLLWKPSSAWRPMTPPLLSWLSKGLRRQTLSSQRNCMAFPRENLQSAATIGQGEPKVRQCHRPVQIVICPSTMRGDASPRTVSCGSAIVIGTTSAMSLRIGGVPKSERHIHHDGTQQKMLPQWGRVDSELWRDHLDKSGGQTSSKPATLIGLTGPGILKNLFRFIRPLLRPPEVMIE